MSSGVRARTRSVRNAALAAVVIGIVIAGALAALAAKVEPELVSETANQTCDDFARTGQSWTELKVDPPANGTKSDGTLTVTITNLTDTKTFDWSSNIGVDAVYVKAGNGGSYLYRYDDPTSASDPGEQTSDTGLTSPGAGTTNQISHIAFCYDVESSPSPSPSPSQSETPTPTPTPTETVTPSPSPTVTPSESPSVLPTSIETGSGSPSVSVLGEKLGRTGADVIRVALFALMLIGLGIGSYVLAHRARNTNR
jgi:hypothetical protein